MPKRNIFEPRETYTSRDVMAGCFVCHDTTAVWFGPNAQGVAARHHDATGHPTWADVNLCIRCQLLSPKGEQLAPELSTRR